MEVLQALIKAYLPRESTLTERWLEMYFTDSLRASLNPAMTEVA